MENLALRNYLAELLGTFTLVFIGSLSLLAAVATDAPFVITSGSASASRCWPASMRSARSPAATSTPPSRWRCSSPGGSSCPTMIGYWISQFLGAILASLAVLAAFSQDDVAGTVTQASANWDAFWLELLLTTIFVAVILQSSRSQRVFGTALLAIPLTLVAIHLAAIPVSGSSVNPVRSLAPALVGNEWGDVWIYLTAPLIGGVIGAVIHGALYGRYVVVDVETVQVAEPEDA